MSVLAFVGAQCWEDVQALQLVEVRFKEYRRGLERLGRRHGVRLDLRRTDPVFAPMHEALTALKAESEATEAAAARAATTALEQAAAAGRGATEEGRARLRAQQAPLQEEAQRLEETMGLGGGGAPSLVSEVPQRSHSTPAWVR